MVLPSIKVESRSDVSGDDREAEEVTSRARVRIAELLQKPFDVRSIASHWPVCFGSLLHYLFHALGPAADRSCAAAQLSFKANSAWTRSTENSAADGRGFPPNRPSWICRLWDLSAGHAHGGMAPE